MSQLHAEQVSLEHFLFSFTTTVYIRTTTITAISDAGSIQWEGGTFIVKVNCLKSTFDCFLEF